MPMALSSACDLRCRLCRPFESIIAIYIFVVPEQNKLNKLKTGKKKDYTFLKLFFKKKNSFLKQRN
jgi:hypothetical protein